MNIQELLKNRLDNIEYPETLFGLTWENLNAERCPYCAKRLHDSRNKKILYCKNKTHKTFVIHRTRLDELNSKRL